MNYLISYGSNSQKETDLISISRNVKHHGARLLGNQVGGWVNVYKLNGRKVSTAHYDSQMGGRWINVTF